MQPNEFGRRVAELLQDTDEDWKTDEGAPMLRAFYVCADFGDFEGRSFFLAFSGDGNGEDHLSPWQIEGMLSHAIRNGFWGFTEQNDDDLMVEGEGDGDA